MSNINRIDFDKINCLIELHMHLDGAITLPIARKLAEMQNIEIPTDDKELLKLIQIDGPCEDLTDYLSKFDFSAMLLQTREGLKEAVKLVFSQIMEQGVMYAETRMAPQLHCERGMTQEEAVLATLEGLKEAPVEGGVILCCMRGDNVAEANLETVRLAKKYLGKGVVALDLAGAEALFPTEDYADLFARAREEGIPFTIHAGEAAGPESVRTALSFGAYRIGHGVRAVEDSELLAELAKRQIPLELCPTSNIDTRIYPCIKAYPIRKLLDSGIKVTLNTDDKAISNTILRREYTLLQDECKVKPSELKQILLNTADSVFAGEDVKNRLRARIEEELSFC